MLFSGDVSMVSVQKDNFTTEKINKWGVSDLM